MVHALREIWRVLAPEGVLLDLRPIADRWPIEVETFRRNVSTVGESQAAGRVEDLPAQLADDMKFWRGPGRCGPAPGQAPG